MPSSNRGEKRNRKVLLIIPGPFAPKHIDIYVEETLKAIARTQSAEGALTVQDVYEVTDSDGKKSRARRDLQHQVCTHCQLEVGICWPAIGCCWHITLTCTMWHDGLQIYIGAFFADMPGRFKAMKRGGVTSWHGCSYCLLQSTEGRDNKKGMTVHVLCVCMQIAYYCSG